LVITSYRFDLRPNEICIIRQIFPIFVFNVLSNLELVRALFNKKQQHNKTLSNTQIEQFQNVDTRRNINYKIELYLVDRRLHNFINQCILPHLQPSSNKANFSTYEPNIVDPYEYDRVKLLSMNVLDTNNNTVNITNDVNSTFQTYYYTKSFVSFALLFGSAFLPLSFEKLGRLRHSTPKILRTSDHGSIDNYSSISNLVSASMTKIRNIFSTKNSCLSISFRKNIYYQNHEACEQRFSGHYLKRKRQENQQTTLMNKNLLKDELDSGYSSSGSIDSETNDYQSYTKKIIQHRPSQITAYPVYDNSTIQVHSQDENNQIASSTDRHGDIASTEDSLLVHIDDKQRRKSGTDSIIYNRQPPTIIMTRPSKQDNEQQQQRLYMPKRHYSPSSLQRSTRMDHRLSRKDNLPLSSPLKPILSKRRLTEADFSSTRGSVAAPSESRRSIFSSSLGIESSSRLNQPRVFDDKTVVSSSFRNENTSKFLIGTLWNTFALVNNLFLQKARRRRDALTSADLNPDQLEHLQRLAQLANYYNQQEETDYENDIDNVYQQQDENTTHELETIMHALQHPGTVNLERILSDLRHPIRRFSSTSTTSNLLPKRQSATTSTNTDKDAVSEHVQGKMRTIQVQTDIEEETQHRIMKHDQNQFCCSCQGIHKNTCIYYDDSIPLDSEIRILENHASNITSTVSVVHQSTLNSDHLSKIIADIHQNKQPSYSNKKTIMKDSATTTDPSIEGNGGVNEHSIYTNTLLRRKSVIDLEKISKQSTYLNVSTQYSPSETDISPEFIISKVPDQDRIRIKYSNATTQYSSSDKGTSPIESTILTKSVISKTTSTDQNVSDQRETVFQQLKRTISIRNTPSEYDLPPKHVTQTQDENFDFESSHTVRSLVSMFELPQTKSTDFQQRRNYKIKSSLNLNNQSSNVHRQQTPIIDEFPKENSLSPPLVVPRRQQTPPSLISDVNVKVNPLIIDNSNFDRQMLINQYATELTSAMLANVILTISRSESTDNIQTNDQSTNTDNRTPRFSSYTNGNGKGLLFQTHTFVPNIHKSIVEEDEDVEISTKNDTDTNTLLDTVIEQTEVKSFDHSQHTLIAGRYIDGTRSSDEEQKQQVKENVNNQVFSSTRSYSTRMRNSVDDSWRFQYDKSSSSENEPREVNESNTLQYLSKSQQFAAHRMYVKPWLKRRIKSVAQSSVPPEVYSTNVIDSKISPTTDNGNILVQKQSKHTKSFYNIIEEETFADLNTRYASLLTIAVYVKSVQRLQLLKDDVMVILHSHLTRLHQMFENNIEKIELPSQTQVLHTVNDNGNKRYRTSFIVDVSNPSSTLHTTGKVILANDVEWKTVKITVRRFRKKFIPFRLDTEFDHTNQISSKLKLAELIELQPYLKHFDNLSQHRVQKYAAHYAEKI
ncbi:unnamed protein product, partial [Didymodactylos carnosus]